MKSACFAALLVSLSLCAASAKARDDMFILPIKDTLETSEAKEKLGGNIKFYFADQPHPDVEAMLKQGQIIHKKARASRSDWADNEATENDEKGCGRALLVSLRILEKHVRKLGGNAVVNIESFYKNNVYRSDDKFECHAGNGGSHVFLKGDIVRLKQ
jgi:uncharacterized protein YbjQ (UPF0145 family)